MDRRTILELAEAEIPEAARQHAEIVAEHLLAQISDSITEKVNDWLMDNLEDGDLEEVARDLIQPAFAMHVTDHLSNQLRDACGGWRSVFWTNIAERYAATGEV